MLQLNRQMTSTVFQTSNNIKLLNTFLLLTSYIRNEEPNRFISISLHTTHGYFVFFLFCISKQYHAVG